MKDMNKVLYVLGLEIHWDRIKKTLGLSQKAYIETVLEIFKIKDYSFTAAPIIKGTNSVINNVHKIIGERTNEEYSLSFVIGGLMYAQVCTRPDFAYVLGIPSRYQSNSGLEHWKATKKVMRCLQGTKD